MTWYGVEERVIVPIEITAEELLSQKEAAMLLGVRPSSVAGRMISRALTVIWRLAGATDGTTARFLLRSEVEALAADPGRRSGGARRLQAPVVSVAPAPALDGVAFGRETWVVRLADDIGDGDVISQARACEVLGLSRSALWRQVMRGRFTVVWQLTGGVRGAGKSSARMLLRSEVEEAAAGGRQLRRDNYLTAPGV